MADRKYNYTGRETTASTGNVIRQAAVVSTSCIYMLAVAYGQVLNCS